MSLHGQNQPFGRGTCWYVRHVIQGVNQNVVMMYLAGWWSGAAIADVAKAVFALPTSPRHRGAEHGFHPGRQTAGSGGDIPDDPMNEGPGAGGIGIFYD